MNETLKLCKQRVLQKCGVTGRRYTYAEARDASNWVARSLVNMGFKPGDVIAVVLPNLPETPIAFLGSIEAGLIVTTVNPNYTAGNAPRCVYIIIFYTYNSVYTFLSSSEEILREKHCHFVPDEVSRQLISSGAKGVITSGEIVSTVLRAAQATLPEKSPFIMIDDGTEAPLPSGSIPFKVRSKCIRPIVELTTFR